MPQLNGTLLEEDCPDCLTRGKNSKLVQVTQDWNMEEEGGKSIVLKQCPCGYNTKLFDELPLLNEPSNEELGALRGNRTAAYRVDDSFIWVFDYFRKAA